MTIDIHPSAKDNFDKKATELLKLVRESKTKTQPRKDFPSELYIQPIKAEHIIGEIKEAKADYLRNIVDRFFNYEGKKFCFGEDNYKQLKKISEKIQSLPTIREKLSVSFVEEKLFEWVSEKYKKSHISDSFIEYLDSEAKKVVQKFTLYSPIAFLEVEVPFSIGNSKIQSLSKQFIDEWKRNYVDNAPDELKEDAIKIWGEKIEKYQGLASVVSIIEAEPKYAIDYAIEQAQTITSILGIFLGMTLVPDIKCISKIKGTENIEIAKIFGFGQNNGQGKYPIFTDKVIDKSPTDYQRLSQERISHMKVLGLDKVSALLVSDSLNKFQESVLNSIFLYSKSAFTAEPVEKIVYVLSSLESMLLKNENEPIQQNLGERIAFFSSKKLEERKNIIKIVKSIYGIRSRYLHHGHNSSELESIKEFLTHIFAFYIRLLDNVNRFKTKEDFVNAIDDLKYS